MHLICMSVYPKNHKSDVENELRMVPLRRGKDSTLFSKRVCKLVRFQKKKQTNLKISSKNSIRQPSLKGTILSSFSTSDLWFLR